MVVKEVVDQLRRHWERAGQKDPQLLQTIKTYLTAQKVPRSYQRVLFLPYRDFFYHQKLSWANLGAVAWAEEDFTPHPGRVADPLREKYIWQKQWYGIMRERTMHYGARVGCLAGC